MPKFKVGDKVKFVKSISGALDSLIGFTGEIRTVDDGSLMMYGVRFLGAVGYYTCAEEELTTETNIKYLVEWRSNQGYCKEFMANWEEALNKVESLARNGSVITETIFLHTITKTQQPALRKVDLVDV